MTESNHQPEPHPYRPLAPSARRAVAGMMLHTATGEADLLGSTVLVDALDSISWGLLAAAGLTPNEARTVLAQLWVTE